MFYKSRTYRDEAAIVKSTGRGYNDQVQKHAAVPKTSARLNTVRSAQPDAQPAAQIEPITKNIQVVLN